MLDFVSKQVFHGLARNRTLERLASRYGMAKPTSFARRFIAGETVEDAIAAARAVQARGLQTTLDRLGESVTTLAGADRATRDYIDLLDRIVASGIDGNISIKLTQLGLDIDRAVCMDNVRRLLDAALRLRSGQAGGDFFVRIDMEDSSHTSDTLDLFETLWQQGYRHAGIVLQADLRRSEKDLERINALGARVRLVKGAYKEPKDVAYQRQSEVVAAFRRMMRVLLLTANYPAIATHDVSLIDEARAVAREHHIGNDRFEFQLLYGIRRDLQATLVAAGYRVRLYIPFGTQWFPYFMRRLGERPENVMFVVRAILGERALGQL